MKKALFTATVDQHILSFHVPYLKMLQEMGYEVHVATNGTAKIPYCDVRHTVSFARSPLKLANLKAIRQLRKIINREKFDLIHTHTPMGSVVTRLAALHARKKYRTRVIYTAHGFHFYKGAPKLNWMIFYPIEKLLSRYTDTLITINKEDYELAKKRFKTDVRYVPGVGIDPKKFDIKMSKADKHALRKSLGLKDTDFVLMFPGELNKNKNQILLINVMEQLAPKHPDIHLLLVGQGILENYYKATVQAKNLQNNVHFLGYRKDIPQLLQITDVAVSSSLREGLGMNILEAMCAGKPVVATATRGTRDLVRNSKNGYLISHQKAGYCFNDKSEFVSLVEKIYQDSTLLRALSKDTHSYSSMFSLDKCLNRYISILEL